MKIECYKIAQIPQTIQALANKHVFHILNHSINNL
jgi:hypothetical protein